MNLHSQLITSMLSMIVCVMRKLPFFNVIFLMKDMMCAALQLFKAFLQRIRIFPIAVPVMDFFELIFRCNAEIGIQSTAERKLFDSVGFNYK